MTWTCHECNHGLLDYFSDEPAERMLHPYFTPPIGRWLTASVDHTDPRRGPIELRDSGLITLADKDYIAANDHIAVPYHGRGKPPAQKAANRARALPRASGERASAQLKT